MPLTVTSPTTIELSIFFIFVEAMIIIFAMCVRGKRLFLVQKKRFVKCSIIFSVANYAWFVQNFSF